LLEVTAAQIKMHGVRFDHGHPLLQSYKDFIVEKNCQ